MKRVLFIDRDGTLIQEYPPTYQIDSFDKVSFYPYVFKYMGKIAEELDYELVLVTNQDGLGTDAFPEKDFWPPHNLIMGSFANEGIIFKEELEALKDKFINRFRIYHILSREKTEAPINTGRIDMDKLELLFSKLVDLEKCDDIFLCGPEEMIFCIKGYLASRGFAAEKIHFELFTVPGQKNHSDKKPVADKPEAGPMAKVSVKLDGIYFDFDLNYEGPSILDAALQQGADLPYACKGGVCTTCKAKLTEGKVSMDVNWGLEPDEVEKGFILTCQSHPVTAKVTVDFDAR